MTKFDLAQSVRRVEDPRPLKGGGRYTDDIVLPGMLHGIVLRSPHAAAKLNAIDTATASLLAMTSALQAFINSQTRAADSGSDFGCMPIADAIALAMTAATGTTPPSPAPLAPSGLFGDGYCSRSNTRMVGQSVAAGSA